MCAGRTGGPLWASGLAGDTPTHLCASTVTTVLPTHFGTQNRDISPLVVAARRQAWVCEDKMADSNASAPHGPHGHPRREALCGPHDSLRP